MGDDFDFDSQFDFHSDMGEGARRDADSHSPTLRRYHQRLWSKTLRSGQELRLQIPSRRSDGYLIHVDSDGTTECFGSDAITNSYSGWLQPAHLVQAMAALDPGQRRRYLNPAYTVGSTMIWPVRSKSRPTMNQARGTRRAIADRMDLTLECVRRHYAGLSESPLTDVLSAYGDFFARFQGFDEFVEFFHFDDLVSNDSSEVIFFLPCEDFTRSGLPLSLDEYVRLREATMTFIDKRQSRIAKWVARHTEHTQL